MPNSIKIDYNLFDNIFPFYFVTNQFGKVLRIGRSLKKINSMLKSRSSISDFFKVRSGANINLCELTDLVRNQAVVLVSSCEGYELMGQIVPCKRSKRYVFVVNLLIHEVSKISKLNLTFSDFAIQDQMFDFLMLLQANARTIKTIEKINKKLTIATESANKSSILKSQFLANMSHELRTPMNGVLGMADVLLSTDLSVEQKEYVDAIITSGDNMLTLINDILDLSKIEAGFMLIKKTNINILNLINDIFVSMKFSMSDKDVELEFVHNLDEYDCIVSDVDRLRQVLMNLVGNAVKFTEKGVVKVYLKNTRLNNAQLDLQFQIDDTGIGMSADTLSKIFNPFVQGDSSSTKQYGGTGLGLCICKKIVNALGGNISAKSQIGRGSSFYFNIIADG